MLLRRALSAAVVVVCGVAGYASAAVPGSSVTLVPMSVMDGSSFHLDTLRSRVQMPTPCAADKSGELLVPEWRDSVWTSYVGGYNRFNGDHAHRSDYTRTFQGVLTGLDRQFCCNARAGVAFGYEESIARTDGTRFNDDAYYIDLYSAVKTGCLNHRFILGAGIHDFSTRRGFGAWGTATGGVNAHSVNVGYELSRDYLWSADTVATPFMTVNYAFTHFDHMHEHLNGARFDTAFDDVNLLQMGIGGRLTHTFTPIPGWGVATFSSSVAAVAEFSEHRAHAQHGMAGRDSFGVSSMKREPFFVQLGFDLVMPMVAQWEMQAGVFGRLGPDRGGVAGNVGLQYSF